MEVKQAVPSNYKPNYYPPSGSSIYRPGFGGGEQAEENKLKFPGSSGSQILTGLSFIQLQLI